MATSRVEARVLRSMGIAAPTPEDRRLIERGLRIAAGLNLGSPHAEVLAFVCRSLAQEGGLVQEIMDELASRLASGATTDRPAAARRRRRATSHHRRPRRTA